MQNMPRSAIMLWFGLVLSRTSGRGMTPCARTCASCFAIDKEAGEYCSRGPCLPCLREYFKHRRDAPLAQALPAFVPVFAPGVLRQWAELNMDTHLSKLIGKAAAGLFAAVVTVKGQDHRFHVGWEPIDRGGCANQRNDIGLLKA